MHAISTHNQTDKPFLTELCAKLHGIKFGDDVQDPLRFRMQTPVLSGLIQNLAMLLENGLSIPKALATLAAEPSLTKYAWMLNGIRKRLDSGQALSAALAEYPRTFNELIVRQIQVGERSGTMNETLNRISSQFERNGEVRRSITKRLSYPAMIVLAGTGLIIFMMIVVVPEFETVFKESGATLPWITRLVSGCSRLIYSSGWMAALAVGGFVLVFRKLRSRAAFAEYTDRIVLRIPIVGRWIRDYAILQFIDTAGIMMDSGFVPVEAISSSLGSISNRAVRKVIAEIASALRRGQKLSDELSRYPDMFPPTISQLVIVGEQTGNMSQATNGVRKRLRRQLETRIDSTVSFIEPLLTLLLAALIGCVVMAIYMPMFGMLESME